jgi:hypothetical protein
VRGRKKFLLNGLRRIQLARDFRFVCTLHHGDKVFFAHGRYPERTGNACAVLFGVDDDPAERRALVVLRGEKKAAKLTFAAAFARTAHLCAFVAGNQVAHFALSFLRAEKVEQRAIGKAHPQLLIHDDHRRRDFIEHCSEKSPHLNLGTFSIFRLQFPP